MIEKSRTQFENVSMQSFSDKTADSETFNRKFKNTQFTEILINRFFFLGKSNSLVWFVVWSKISRNLDVEWPSRSCDLTP